MCWRLQLFHLFKASKACLMAQATVFLKEALPSGSSLRWSTSNCFSAVKSVRCGIWQLSHWVFPRSWVSLLVMPGQLRSVWKYVQINFPKHCTCCVHPWDMLFWVAGSPSSSHTWHCFGILGCATLAASCSWLEKEKQSADVWSLHSDEKKLVVKANTFLDQGEDWQSIALRGHPFRHFGLGGRWQILPFASLVSIEMVVGPLVLLLQSRSESLALDYALAIWHTHMWPLIDYCTKNWFMVLSTQPKVRNFWHLLLCNKLYEPFASQKCSIISQTSQPQPDSERAPTAERRILSRVDWGKFVELGASVQKFENGNGFASK